MRTIILSLSRSGSTALYYDILRAMPAATRGYFEPTAEALRAVAAIPGEAVAKLMLETVAPVELIGVVGVFDRRILLVRDPRDRLVSSFLFAIHGVEEAELRRRLQELERKRLAPRSVSFLALVGRIFPDWKPFDVVARAAGDLARVAAARDTVPDAFLLRYEDYVAGDSDGLDELLSANVRYGQPQPPEHAYGLRRATPGDWKNWFIEDDVTALRPVLEAFLEEHGYDTDWSLPQSPCIPAEHSTEFVQRAFEKDRAFKRRGVTWRSGGDES